MTQSVPSQTSIAHAPAVAARIAVPAVFELAGLTFEDAEMTVYVPDRFLRISTRPVLAEAVGSVTDTFAAEPLQMMTFSSAPTVNEAVLVTGAFVVTRIDWRTARPLLMVTLS